MNTSAFLSGCTACFGWVLVAITALPARGAAPTGVFVSAGPLFTSEANLTSAPLTSGNAFVAGAWSGSVFSVNGSWQMPVPFHASRYGSTTQLLADGRIALIGTASASANVPAEIVDPDRGTTVASGPTLVKRYGPTVLPRPDGKVFVWGGLQSGTSWPPLSQAELFDPATATFANAGTALPGRWNAALTLLADGRYLLTGGSTADQVVQQVAVVYSQATNAAAPTGAMTKLRWSHTATLLNDGRVLVCGGMTYANSSQDVSNAAEVYTPSDGVFASIPHMYAHCIFHTASMLADGQVLIAGGIGEYGEYVIKAELFDPATNTFTVLPPMLHPRKSATAVSLGGGRVLIAGGSDAQGIVEESETFVYDTIIKATFESP